MTRVGTDELDAAALRAALLGSGSRGADGWWQGIDVVPATGSTNADLAAAARAGATPVRALLTANQTAGRGRLDRTWVAPPGTGIACSVLVAPTRPLDRWTWVPLLAGMAVCEALRQVAGVDAVLKWPNDVLLVTGAPAERVERKVCGVLAERVQTPVGPACVIGIGLNVELSTEQLPVPTATSLAQAGARTLDRTVVALGLLRSVERAIRGWESAADDAAVAAAYGTGCATLGRAVRLVLATGDVTGTAESVDEGGRLIVRTPAGLRTFSAGDVVHLR
ncbi:MAG: biotin--[acetyl-CoA-carboxylase] ligase [Propionibacteriaceae bacterium]